MNITPQTPAKFEPLVDLAPDLLLWPQKTPGFLIEWNRNLKPNPVMLVQFDGLGGVKPLFIEFQAILANATANPTDGLLLPTSLALEENGIGSFSKIVPVKIPPPLIMKSVAPVGKYTRAVLNTIRIPFSLYQVPNAKALVYLKLDFGMSQVAASRIAITGFRAIVA